MCSARPTDAPKLDLYALNIGWLEVRRLVHSTKKYRLSATGDVRDNLPQSLWQGVNDSQTAILLCEELALQSFSGLIKVCNTGSADALHRKISTICSLCISVGALLHNRDSHGEWQIRNASHSAKEACRVLST